MKIKNLKVGAAKVGTIAVLGIYALNKAISLRGSVEELEQSIIDDNQKSVHTESALLEQWVLEQLNQETMYVPVESIGEPRQIEIQELEKEKTVEEEIEELLKEKPEYMEIAKYVSEITEEDVDAYVKEVLDFYGVTAKRNTFRFNPNNLQEAERRIKAYAEKIDTEENAIFTTVYHIYSTEDDSLVSSYRREYQESHPEASEEELEEVEKEFKEKAAAIYYTKMNLKYLSDESLRSMNEKYHFVGTSENLIEDIKDYMNEIAIHYTNYPLMREMVANQGDYIAHGLLNADDTVWEAFDIIDDPVVNGVIQGVYGNGEERREKIYDVGYCSYEIIQEAVNQKLGVGKKRKSVFYRIEDGKAVSNLPVLPTDQDELYKYLLIELKYQSQHYGFYGPESYDPSEFLIKRVIYGHYNQIYHMLYETEEITDDAKRAILEELDYHRYVGDAIKFFETVEKVQEVTGTYQKIK